MTIRLSKKQWTRAAPNLPLSVRKAKEKASKKAKVVPPTKAASFKPDWKLGPADALAVQMRLALHRRGMAIPKTLYTDDAWLEMCQEIIDECNTGKLYDIKIGVRVVSKAKAHAGEKK